MKSESAIENSIINYLKELRDSGEPITFEKRVAGGLSYKEGVPDIYFTYYGFHFEVEVKNAKGQLRTMQETYRRLLLMRHVPHFVVNSLDLFKAIIVDIIELKDILKNVSDYLLDISNLYKDAYKGGEYNVL